MKASTFWNPYAPMSSKTRAVFAASTLTVVLIAWFIVSTMGWVNSYKLPSPQSVVQAFIKLSWNGSESLLGSAILSSTLRVVTASLLVIAVGIPLGLLMGASTRLNAVFSPLLDPFRSAPIVAFLPLFVMWFGIDETMKIAFLFTGAIVYMVPMVRDAVRSVPSQYLVSAQDIGATPMEAVFKVLLPLAMPRITDAIITSVSLMWTYITVAEYVNAQDGLGQLIQNARRFSAMDQVFVGIITIIAIALLTYQGMSWMKNKLYRWETQL